MQASGAQRTACLAMRTYRHSRLGWELPQKTQRPPGGSGQQQQPCPQPRSALWHGRNEVRLLPGHRDGRP